MRQSPIGWRAGLAGAERLRVLHVINGLGPGGAEALLYNLIVRSPNLTHEVISLSGPDRYSIPLADHGIRIHHLNMTCALAVVTGLVQLNKLIRESQADVIQTWLYKSNVLGGLFAFANGIPVVWGIHCSSLDALGFGSRMIAYTSGLLAPWIPDFIVNCSSRSAELHQRLGYQLAPGAVIPNGYDQATFFPDNASRMQCRKSLGVPSDVFLIGTIGRWHFQKGIPILLQAARIVRDRGHGLKCLLVGRGLESNNSELFDLITNFAAHDFVKAIGERTDIPNIARALDLHVLASVGSEAFPNVVGETLLSGTPNVVTDVGDSALMVGDTGWVVSPRDPSKLADAIEKALTEWQFHPDLWATRRSAARKRIADNYTLDRMLVAYEQVWSKVADLR